MTQTSLAGIPAPRPDDRAGVDAEPPVRTEGAVEWDADDDGHFQRQALYDEAKGVKR